MDMPTWLITPHSFEVQKEKTGHILLGQTKLHLMYVFNRNICLNTEHLSDI